MGRGARSLLPEPSPPAQRRGSGPARPGRPRLTQQALQEDLSPQPGHGRDVEQRFFSQQHAPAPPRPAPAAASSGAGSARTSPHRAGRHPPARGQRAQPSPGEGGAAARPPPHPTPSPACPGPCHLRAPAPCPRAGRLRPRDSSRQAHGGLGPRRRAKPGAPGPAAEQPGEGALQTPGGAGTGVASGPGAGFKRGPRGCANEGKGGREGVCRTGSRTLGEQEPTAPRLF